MENSRYEFGPFLLSVAQRSLFKGRRTVELDAIQFDLLLLLVESAGQVVSKDAMIARVWEGQIVEEGTIFTTISRLRAVLKKGGSQKQRQVYIRTVSKKGYCFVCPVRKLGDLDSEPAVVKESAHRTEMMSMQFDPYQKLEELTIAVKFMGTRLQQLESLILRAMSLTYTRWSMENTDAGRAEFCFNLVHQAVAKLFGPEQSAWLDRLEAEQDNLRWTLDHYSGDSRELEMAGNLGLFWYVRGHWNEGRTRLQRALAQTTDQSPALAKALIWAGWLALCQDDYQDAQNSMDRSAEISRRINDQESLAFSLNCLGYVAEAEGHYQDANQRFNDSLKLSRELNLNWLTGWTCYGLGLIAENESNYQQARDRYHESLQIREEMQDLRGVAGALDRLGIVAREQGDYPESRRMHERSLAIRQGIGFKMGIATCYFNLGLLEEVLQKPAEASLCFQKSLTIRKEMDDRRGVAKALEAIGKMALMADNKTAAARIFGAAENLRALIGAPLSVAEQKSYGAVRDSLKKKYSAQWEEGAQQQPEELIGNLS